MEHPASAPRPPHDAKRARIAREFAGVVKKVRRALAAIDESLKPLGKEKYLEEYIELKKRSAKLSSRMRETEKVLWELSGKDRKKIVRKAAALVVFLRKRMGRPRRRRYREVTRKIRAYARMLRDVRS